MSGIPRPLPPESNPDIIDRIVVHPAHEVKDWAWENILSSTGSIHNPDHGHLIDADIRFMWASDSYGKAGRIVFGQCEQVMIRASAWQKARQEQQLCEWFGEVPKFIITLAADYCADCTDEEFCALVEHELYHIAQAKDEFGAPKFDKETGQPVLKLQGHDVEEFFGVVRRYGPSEEVRRMADIAGQMPEVSKINVARACGTCLMKAV